MSSPATPDPFPPIEGENDIFGYQQITYSGVGSTFRFPERTTYISGRAEILVEVGNQVVWLSCLRLTECELLSRLSQPDGVYTERKRTHLRASP